MSSSDQIPDLHRTLDSLVYERLWGWIVDGRLAPGTRLVEANLAQELGTSRGPVREAIRQLDHEGFVTISPRRGAWVAEVSTEHALDCYDVRLALESIATKLAAERRTKEHIEKVRSILERGLALLEAENWGELGAANSEFHQALAEASGNRELLRLRVQYDRRFTWIFSRSARRRGGAAWAEHAEIVEAVAHGDVDQAGLLAELHIHRSKSAYLAVSLERQVGDQAS